MKAIAAILSCAAALLSCAVQAQVQPAAGAHRPNPGNAASADDPAVKAAVAAGTDAAQRWLALADADRWDDCWAALAPAAQQAIDQDGFAAALGAVRDQYGAVKSRKPHGVTVTHRMPNAPPGDYVVVQYDTEFANGVHALETVIPMRTPDGSWRVSTYFVH